MIETFKYPAEFAYAKMGAKNLLLAAALMLLVIGCSTVGKTKPVVTDIGSSAANEPAVQETPIQKENASSEVKQETVIEANNLTATTSGNATAELNKLNVTVAKPGEHIIIIKDLKFDPLKLTIPKGDTVIWENQDTSSNDGETTHYIAAHSNEFRSYIIHYGSAFSHTFNKTGNFTYIDVIYKERAAMRGTIIVE